MNVFSALSYLAGYHVLLILLSFIGIVRFPKTKPWIWFCIGFLIQLFADFQFSDSIIPSFAVFLYLIIVSLLLISIIRIQSKLNRR